MNRLKCTLGITLMCSFLMTMAMASGSHHDEKASASLFKGTQKLCPVRKKAIDTSDYAKVEGQKVYFCCGGCSKKFKKSPSKYFSVMKSRGEVAENIQTACPVSGEDLGAKKVEVALAGRNVYLCCKKCAGKFKKSPSKYLKKIK
jgi:YHS domain-containing protein